MPLSETSGANAEQIKFWNEVGGPRWVREQAALDAMLEPLGRKAMDAAAIAAALWLVTARRQAGPEPRT